MDIKNSTENGVTYAMVTKPSTTLVVVHISADLGIVLEAQESVTRSLLCDLLLSGAGAMTREAFLDAVNEAGGSIGVSESEGKITITVETIESKLPKILTLLKLMITKPRFDTKEITRAKETYKKQLKLACEQAKAMANLKLIQSLYQNTERAYQYTPKEEQAVINDIVRKDFLRLHDGFLKTDWVVTIGSNQACNKKVKAVVNGIRKSKSKFDTKATEVASSPQLTTKKVSPKFTIEQISSQQNIEVSLGQRLNITLLDIDYPAVVFALSVLGKWGGFSGRLMSTVREKEGLTYGIYARAESVYPTEFGHWRVMTFFHPKDLEKGMQSVMREISKLYRSGITEIELKRFKTILQTSHALMFDSLTTLTGAVHAYSTKNIDFVEYEKILRNMQLLTKKDIDKAIKKYLNPTELSYSLAGNLAPLDLQLKTLCSSLKISTL